MVKVLIFDMGGVLLKGNLEAVVQRVSDRLEVKFTRSDLLNLGYRRMRVGWPFTDFLQILKEEYDLILSVEELLEIWRELYLKATPINQELLNFIEDARGKYRIALISNVNDFHVLINKERSLFKSFDLCVLSCEVGLAKPDEAIYELALERLDFKSGECVFVDDRRECLLPAEELGFKTIRYESNSQLFDDLQSLGVVVERVI